MAGTSTVTLWVIAGPTASGKSALGLELAEACNAEIVSCDSQQVYRHFDIGTAKPSIEEQRRVPHHLIDVAEPHELFSAARFQTMADQAIASIVAKGKKPIVVGGTGLYLRVLLHGVVAAPPADAALRLSLEQFANENGNAALHQRLQQVDADTAAELPVGDRLRVIRALEIFELTQIPASAHRKQHAFEAQRYRPRILVVDLPREQLYQRINERTHALFSSGLVDEVQRLVDKGFEDTAPMKSVGYVEALQVVKGTLSFGPAIELVAQRTRHYAKRQLTWFKKESGAQLVSAPVTVSVAKEFFSAE